MGLLTEALRDLEDEGSRDGGCCTWPEEEGGLLVDEADLGGLDCPLTLMSELVSTEVLIPLVLLTGFL